MTAHKQAHPTTAEAADRQISTIIIEIIEPRVPGHFALGRYRA
jgi:hypothetical protein